MNVSRETRAKSFSMPRPDNIVSLSIITYTFHIIWHELHSPEQRHRFQSYWWWAICLYPSGYVFHNHSVYTISYVFASGSSQTHTLYNSLNLYFFTSSRNYQIESRLAEETDKILHLKYGYKSIWRMAYKSYLESCHSISCVGEEWKDKIDLKEHYNIRIHSVTN